LHPPFRRIIEHSVMDNNMKMPKILSLAALLIALTVVLTEARVVHQPPIPLAAKICSVPKPSKDAIIQTDSAAVRMALKYYQSHRSKLKNHRYLTVIDYTKPSFSERMYLVDLKTKKVEKYLVAHGKNSGAIYATEFSNQTESLKSCRGLFVTGKTYGGKHGKSLVLHGLQKGVNDKALERGIVMHGAEYVDYRAVTFNGGRLGRSFGCPAVPLSAVDEIVGKIKDGSLLYIHSGPEPARAKGPVPLRKASERRRAS
jgi:hypothetical protein